MEPQNDASASAETLKPPFEAITQPLEPSAYQPPIYDHARSTPQEWAREADARWTRHRDRLLELIQAEFKSLIQSGELKLFDRPRVSRQTNHKAPILDETTAYELAAKRFLWGTTWAALADQYPPPSKYRGNPTEKAKQKKTRANQIRMRVRPILKCLGLPDEL